MASEQPEYPRSAPSEAAESEEQELWERSAAERAPRVAGAPEPEDPREEDGWTQPESSAQKGVAGYGG
jgi:hypothetical protein